MSRCQYMYLKPLFITNMNRKHLAETRREPIHGGSASASLRLTVSARFFRFMSLDIIVGQQRYKAHNSKCPLKHNILIISHSNN